ncbi:MAG: hypothetical protein PHU24_04250 [Sphaerochaetaceae bacterium]|jgi:hypothetical protein|nr:hypothetical protein [Sphaerochaetaceae bacterium]NLO61124.1 hypothetical protein [Spirochaetales bacterium]MDD2405652.1 hypothetical protein [Sphaerochaetaceae bacterium]MDD4259755.1 hypothetical protein [Sphaerochaetaceae bacterium]MDD4763328.1 hypothetical protein [Sphaerochaetaceae bacterium]
MGNGKRTIYALFILGLIASVSSCGMDLFYDPYNIEGKTYDWMTVSTEHFMYHYTDDTEDSDWTRILKRFDGTEYECESGSIKDAALEYARHFEMWYERLSELFGTDPAKHVPIDVYNYPSIETQAGLIGSKAAQSMEYAPVGSCGYVIHLGAEGVCAHELIHIFQTTKANAPPLLSEGMAVALAGANWTLKESTRNIIYADLPTLPLSGSLAMLPPRWQNLDLHKSAAKAIGLGDFDDTSIRQVPIAGLRPSDLVYWGNNLSTQWYVYCVGGSFIHYLVFQYHWDRFLSWYEAVNSSVLLGADLLSEFYKAYGKTFIEVEGEWLAMLGALT